MKFMRAGPIVALVVWLHANDGLAMSEVFVEHDQTIKVAGQKFGFMDGTLVHAMSGDKRSFSWVYVGPLGRINSPVFATQGLIGCCFLVAMLIILPVVLTVRWKKRAAS